VRGEAWRNDPKKSRRFPPELWQAAVNLSKEYSINQISKALRLGYTHLKKCVMAHGKENLPTIKTQPDMKIIELGVEPSSSTPECIVEMEDGNGAKMKIHLRGKTDPDLCELGRGFWSKRS
jgi:transposase-like protein